MSADDEIDNQNRSTAAASASILELALAGDSHMTASDVVAWASVVKEELGLTQQQIADEINVLLGNSSIKQAHVRRAFQGEMIYLKALLVWLESKCAKDPLLFERDERGEPVWRIKIAYERPC